MYCQNCGGKVADGAKFCPSCGNAIKQNATSSVVKLRKQKSGTHPVVTALLICICFLGVIFIGIVAAVCSQYDVPFKGDTVEVEATDTVVQEKKQDNQNGKDDFKEVTLDDGTKFYIGAVSNVGIGIVNAVELKKTIGNKYHEVQPQGKFVAIVVWVCNQQDDAITVHSESFKLLDKVGREYSTSTRAMTVWEMEHDNQGMLTKINPGNAQLFVFIYDVPESIQVEEFKVKARGGITGDSIVLPLSYNAKFEVE